MDTLATLLLTISAVPTAALEGTAAVAGCLNQAWLQTTLLSAYRTAAPSGVHSLAPMSVRIMAATRPVRSLPALQKKSTGRPASTDSAQTHHSMAASRQISMHLARQCASHTVHRRSMLAVHTSAGAALELHDRVSCAQSSVLHSRH